MLLRNEALRLILGWTVIMALPSSQATPVHKDGKKVARPKRTLTKILSLDIAALHRQQKDNVEIIKQHNKAMRHEQKLFNERLKENLADTSRILAGKTPLKSTHNYIPGKSDGIGSPSLTRELTASTPHNGVASESHPQQFFDVPSSFVFFPRPSSYDIVSESQLHQVIYDPTGFPVIPRKLSTTNNPSSPSELDDSDRSNYTIPQKSTTEATLTETTHTIEVTQSTYEVTENSDDIEPPPQPTTFGYVIPENETILGNNVSSSTYDNTTTNQSRLVTNSPPYSNEADSNEIPFYNVSTIEESEFSNGTADISLEENFLVNMVTKIPYEVNEDSDDIEPPATPPVFGYVKPEIMDEPNGKNSSLNDTQEESKQENEELLSVGDANESLGKATINATFLNEHSPISFPELIEIDDFSTTPEINDEEDTSLQSQEGTTALNPVAGTLSENSNGENLGNSRLGTDELKMLANVTENKFPTAIAAENARKMLNFTEYHLLDSIGHKKLQISPGSAFTGAEMLDMIPEIIDRLRAGKLNGTDQQLLAEAYGEYWPGIVDISRDLSADFTELIEDFKSYGPMQNPSHSRQARALTDSSESGGGTNHIGQDASSEAQTSQSQSQS